jgi:ankyrin repeat protein
MVGKVMDPKLVEVLLEAGADPKLKNAEGFRPLDLAIKANNSPVIQLLQNCS